MNSPGHPQWPQSDELNSMAAIDDADFADFVDLDLDIAGLEFPIYDNNHESVVKLSDNGDLLLLQGQNAQQRQHSGGQAAPPAPGTDVFDFMPVTFDGSQDATFAMPQQPQPQTGQRVIPPTPNSVEMHSDAARYLQQLDAHTRSVLEQQYQLRKDDAANFTPLVSPAVTPHDSCFRIQHDYIVPPSAYFSPLTSPALEGQHHPYHNNTSVSSFATSSPVDFDVHMLDEAPVSRQSSHKAKSRKRPCSPRTAASGSQVRQSLVAKPQQRRKSTRSAVVPTKEVTNLLDEARQPHTAPASPNFARSYYSQQSSGNDSISPEPLSEALMRPPPKPASSKPSPAILPQRHSSPSSNLQERQGAVPATPASLMHLPPPSPRSANRPVTESPSFGPTATLDELTLPEAATSGEDFPESSNAVPRITARKTPKLGPLHTPGSAAMPPATRPQQSSATSNASSPLIPKKPEQRGRANKKRGSVGNSSMVSPALRPKLSQISPSIKPLLPEGATLTEDSHTLLLATRSNYQNLIEGTTVPGVNYPSELSTNLTSKRTSHKIAEQGRRNRINLALQEMLSLLPRSNGISQSLNLKDGGPDGDDDDDRAAKSGSGKGTGNSKAATVESAIEYIKTLQHETAERKRVIEEKDREVEELRKKLDEAERKLRQSPDCKDDMVERSEPD